MAEDKISDYILGCMKNLNLIVVVYLSELICYALTGFAEANTALDFLMQAEQIPVVPWKIPVIAISLFVCLLLLLHIQGLGTAGFLLKTILEIGICLWISYVLNFSYSGMILIILADAMRFFSGMKWRIAFVSMISIIFLIMDYNLLSIRYAITSLEVCLTYFCSDAQAVLLVLKNVLGSLNILIFILYMVVLIRAQMSEKERILDLNEELNVANDKLTQAYAQLEAYAKESEKAAEARERNRLSREIHDTLGYTLTGIITGLDACTTLVDIAPEAAKKQLEVIGKVARQGMTDVRRSVKALRPDALERLDLENALVQMIDEMRSAAGAQIEYQCTAGLKCFDQDEVDIIYRIVQESITNAIRHGKADRIRIQIGRQYNMLTILIQDNGKGCSEVHKGFGLHHMEERLKLLQGSLRIIPNGCLNSCFWELHRMFSLYWERTSMNLRKLVR